MLALLCSVGPPTPLGAQAPADSARGIAPFGAFWRSLLVPGWGQAATGRHVTGTAFVVWEGVTAMMTLRAQEELQYMRETGSPHLDSKREQVQDWLVLWVFNHLFAGAEAYVAAHLRDFPRELHVEAIPRGVRVTVPLPAWRPLPR